MDVIYILVTFLTLIPHHISTIGVDPCHRNNPERTFGLLFGPWNNDCQPYGDQNPVYKPPQNLGGDDYVDPVYSEEETDNGIDQYRPPNRPDESNSVNGLFNWLPQGFITEDHWPTRPPKPHKPHRPPRPPIRPPHRPPHRPPKPPIYKPPQPPGFLFPGWFNGWFNPAPNYPHKPPKPQKPWGGNKPGDGNIKPVYENVEDDVPPVPWRPGPVVGGPNHDIIPVSQDLSNWSTVPPPKPTRPQIPGYNREAPHTKNTSGIVGSFVDLLFKKR